MKWNQSHFYVWPFSNFQSINQSTNHWEWVVCLFVVSIVSHLNWCLICFACWNQFNFPFIHSINQSSLMMMMNFNWLWQQTNQPTILLIVIRLLVSISICQLSFLFSINQFNSFSRTNESINQWQMKRINQWFSQQNRNQIKLARGQSQSIQSFLIHLNQFNLTNK